MSQSDPTAARRFFRPTRAGWVALILVLVLSLLVGTFAVTVNRRAAAEQHREYERQKRSVLQAAIDAVAKIELESDAAIKLPLDNDNRRWVIVGPAISETGTKHLQAVLYQNGQAGLSLARPLGETQ